MAYPARLFVLPALVALVGCATTPRSPASSAAAPAPATVAKPPPLDEDRLHEAQMLKDERQMRNIEENVENEKVIAAVKEKITLQNKKISEEKFRELK